VLSLLLAAHLACMFCMQVPLLLKDIHIEMRTLGAELLAVFTRVQSPVDSKLDSIQAHVPQVGIRYNSQQFGLPLCVLRSILFMGVLHALPASSCKCFCGRGHS
jgi:hypothetical protein